MCIIPIQTLNPQTPPPPDASIRAIITLSWPYSSSTRQCALLLSDPDFRLRQKRGQIRVRFTGPSAEAVANTQVGIGDEVLLGLEGARWVEEEDVGVKTPGRSVEGLLVYGRRLELRVVARDGVEDGVVVSVDAPPTPKTLGPANEEEVTPAKGRESLYRSSFGDGMVELVPIYSSPTFVKRYRLGSGFLEGTGNLDQFLQDELAQEKPNKRQRISFGDVSTWRFAERSPSPVKTTSSPEVATELEHGHIDNNDNFRLADSTSSIGEPSMMNFDVSGAQETSASASGTAKPHSQALPQHNRMEVEPQSFAIGAQSSITEQDVDAPAAPATAEVPATAFGTSERPRQADTESSIPKRPSQVPLELTAQPSAAVPLLEPSPKYLSEKPPYPESVSQKELRKTATDEQPDSRTALSDIPHLRSDRPMEQQEELETPRRRSITHAEFNGSLSRTMPLKETPQSERDRVMAKTFKSLFGIGASPSPSPERQMPPTVEIQGEVPRTPSEVILQAEPNQMEAVLSTHDGAIDETVTMLAEHRSDVTRPALGSKVSDQVHEAAGAGAGDLAPAINNATRSEDRLLGDTSSDSMAEKWPPEMESQNEPEEDRRESTTSNNDVPSKAVIVRKVDAIELTSNPDVSGGQAVPSLATMADPNLEDPPSADAQPGHSRPLPASVDEQAGKIHSTDAEDDPKHLADDDDVSRFEAAMQADTQSDWLDDLVETGGDIMGGETAMRATEDAQVAKENQQESQLGMGESSQYTLANERVEELLQQTGASQIELMDAHASEKTMEAERLGSFTQQSTSFLSEAVAEMDTQPTTISHVDDRQEFEQPAKETAQLSSFSQARSVPELPPLSTRHDTRSEPEIIDLLSSSPLEAPAADEEGAHGACDDPLISTHQPPRTSTHVNELSTNELVPAMSPSNVESLFPPTTDVVQLYSDMVDIRFEAASVQPPPVHEQDVPLEDSSEASPAVAVEANGSNILLEAVEYPVLPLTTLDSQSSAEIEVVSKQVIIHQGDSALPHTPQNTHPNDLLPLDHREEGDVVMMESASQKRSPELDPRAPTTVPRRDADQQAVLSEPVMSPKPNQVNDVQEAVNTNGGVQDALAGSQSPEPPHEETSVDQIMQQDRMMDKVSGEEVSHKEAKRRPLRKSLKNRLSHVPEVISAWFSPKRSRTLAAETPSKKQKTIYTDGAAGQNTHDEPVTVHQHGSASGLRTDLAYFVPLSQLERRLNPSGQSGMGEGSIDVLAVVTDKTSAPEKSKAGPKDYYTTFHVTDTSLSSDMAIQVQAFRPWKAVLPVAETGDVVLLRAFSVKSRKRQPYLLSTDASAWCVWRYAREVPDGVGDDGVGGKDIPVWAQRNGDSSPSSPLSPSCMREEVKGPPVELGDEERRHAKALREWWVSREGGKAGKAGNGGEGVSGNDGGQVDGLAGSATAA